MIPTLYSEIYDSVISKIKSYSFIKLTEDEAYEILHDYLRPAIVRFKCCKKDLKNRNDGWKTFNIELDDDEIEILANWMFIRYLEANYINVPEMLQGGKLISAKDFHSLNIAPHLAQIKDVRNMYKVDVNDMMSAYSYVDSKLFSAVENDVNL